MVSKSVRPLAWFLALAIAAAILAQTPFLGRVALADDDDDDEDRIRASSPLPNGVAAGEVTENSVVLWARSDLPGLLIFNVAEELEFEDDDDTITAIVAVSDTLIPGKVEITGLEADEEYYYRAQGPGGAASIGRFRTLSESDEDDGVRFGVSGDHRAELGPFVAVRNVVERDLDFFGNLGDTIYADVPSPDLPVLQANTVPEFRIKHQEVYAERLGLNVLADIRSNTVWRPTIDDHEVTDDFSGGAHPSTDTRFAFTTESFINETPLYSNGLQAFQEFNPNQNEHYGATGDPRTAGKRKLYRTWRSGETAAFFSTPGLSGTMPCRPPA